MKTIVWLGLFFTLINSANANPDLPGMWLPVVPNKIPDRYVSSHQQQFSGMLNERLIINQNKRLMQIDTAALLSGFRQRPGSQKWIAEHIGKFLFAGARTYRYTHDASLKKLMDEMALQYIATQLPDGYMGTYLPKDYWTEWDVWAHKYAIIGLLSYYSVTGYEPALTAAKKAADLVCKVFGNETGQLDLNKSGHHAGMAAGSILEPMVEIYRYTKEPRYLKFAEYILANWETSTGPKIMTSLEKGDNVTAVGNAKAYEMMSCFLGILNYYQLTGESRYLNAMQAAWKDITTNRLYITGTCSSKEFFQPDQVLPGSITDRMGEGCVTTTWIQFNEQLLRITGGVAYVSEIERSVYNHLLAAENMITGCVSYYTPLQGAKPQLCKITCCLSSVPRGISMIPEMVWGKINNEFSVLMYEDGEVTDSITTADGSSLSFKLKSTTNFPSDGKIIYKVTPSAAKKFAINFRVPDWSAGYKVLINGLPQDNNVGKFIRVDRVWKATDKVVVQFEMPLQVLPGGKSYPDHIAFQRGPQILSVDSTFNARIIENLSVTYGDHQMLQLKDAKKQLPKQWVGNQAYSLDVGQSQNSVHLVLVPFADAGQLASMQQVWVPVKQKIAFNSLQIKP